MKVFVFEYVTGGGFARMALPGFLHDAEVMWQALVDDLRVIDGVEVLTLRDDRLDRQPALDKVEIPYTEAGRFREDYRHCLAASDAVWVIAPEEAGILESLNREILIAGKRLLGCQPDAVRIAASKFATAQCLSRAGIPVAPTFTSALRMPATGPVVAKPDEGVGCQDTLYFPDRAAAGEWALGKDGAGFVFQPYLPGEPRSLSVLCHPGGCRLLSVNRQHIRLAAGQLHFHGVTTNALPDRDGCHASLARRVAAAIPGLWGYVGIDLIDTEDGPVILEVNPRVTVSYAGMRSALGFNPAASVLALPDPPAPGAWPPAGPLRDERISQCP